MTVARSQGLKPLATILRPFGTPIFALSLAFFLGCGGDNESGGEPQRMIVLGPAGTDRHSPVQGSHVGLPLHVRWRGWPSSPSSAAVASSPAAASPSG